MSASIRFLGFAVLAWAGVRAASLAFAPGSTSAIPAAQAAAIRPVTPTRFDPPPPPDAMPPTQAYPGAPAGYPFGYASGYPGAYPPMLA